MPTDTPETTDKAALLAERFRAMADSIQNNAKEGFGGAFVIVPPDGGGNPIETLVLANSPDLALFWNSVITKCQIMLASVEQGQRQGAFGQRR